jgi:DNA-binding NarL/FixJ family response regulator
MSSALADPFPPRSLVTVSERHVTLVVADAARPESAGARLRQALRHWAGIVTVREIAAVASAGTDAIVLLIGADAPDGMAALRRIRRDAPAARLVVVAGDDGNASTARQVLNAGADAFVAADAMDVALAPALEAVLAGFVCAPRAARRLIAKPTFSHREKEVLGLLVAGLTNRQIASQLFLAESTIKTHLATAFAKLGVRSRKDAVSLLLDPDERLAATALPPDALA